MRIGERFVIFGLIAVMAAITGASAADMSATASNSRPSTVETGNYMRMGKELRTEIRKIYADLKRTKALGSPMKGADVSAIVLKYIPVGTTFEAAETILRSAGCAINVHPGDIESPNRSLRPQEPVMAKLTLGGWPMAHYLSVALVPRENHDYSTVTSVSAAILMAYS